MDTIKAVPVTGGGVRSVLVPPLRKADCEFQVMNALRFGKKHQSFVQWAVFNER
ncbi:hypothetical protein [Desulfovibrio aminophilus]|uniref:hypothetical protein n=1 Tax=Desulfovibrio aminophilus TaxID=81425 RepID=UPI003396EEA6